MLSINISRGKRKYWCNVMWIYCTWHCWAQQSCCRKRWGKGCSWVTQNTIIRSWLQHYFKNTAQLRILCIIIDILKNMSMTYNRFPFPNLLLNESRPKWKIGLHPIFITMPLLFYLRINGFEFLNIHLSFHFTYILCFSFQWIINNIQYRV